MSATRSEPDSTEARHHQHYIPMRTTSTRLLCRGLVPGPALEVFLVDMLYLQELGFYLTSLAWINYALLARTGAGWSCSV